MKNVIKRIDQSVNLWVKKLKHELIYRLSTEYSDVGLRLVSQAVNEADALAAQTSIPALVLPTLAEEKVQQIAAWAARQRSLLGSGSDPLIA